MPRRGDMCLACHRAFAPGETYRALLFETAAGYERRDYCETCEPPDVAGMLGAWRSRRPETQGHKPPVFDRAAIGAFFERLDRARLTPAQTQLRFVLALLLWRKKVLRFTGAATGDGEVWNFVATSTGQEYAVARPELAEDELERLSAQLDQLLAGQPSELTIVAADAVEEEPGA